MMCFLSQFWLQNWQNHTMFQLTQPPCFFASNQPRKKFSRWLEHASKTTIFIMLPMYPKFTGFSLRFNDTIKNKCEPAAAVIEFNLFFQIYFPCGQTPFSQNELCIIFGLVCSFFWFLLFFCVFWNFGTKCELPHAHPILLTF